MDEEEVVTDSLREAVQMGRCPNNELNVPSLEVAR